MSTKAELEKQNKELKEKIRELTKDAKNVESDISTLPYAQVGVMKNSNGNLKLVFSRFNEQNCIITDIKDLNGTIFQQWGEFLKAVDNLAKNNCKEQ